MNRALFSGIENAILLNLQKAEKSIKVAVAWLTNATLFSTLCERLRSEVQVVIILADDRINFSNQQVDFQDFLDAGGLLRISKFPTLMHHKFCLIDEKILITGSYNWTKNAEKHNLENIIVSIEGNLVRQYLIGFSELIHKTERVTDLSTVILHDYSFGLEKILELDESNEPQTPSDYLAQNTSSDALTEIPGHLLEQFEVANGYYRRKKYAQALKILHVLEKEIPQTAEVYDLISCVKWRQKDYNALVEYAEKAIQLNPVLWEAYNMAAIGYSYLGQESKVISYYQVCIEKEPENYIFIKNRAESYLQLDADTSVSITMKKQLKFKEKALLDLKEVIELTNKHEHSQGDYMLFYARGMAKYSLNSNIIRLSKGDFLKAKTLYESAPIEEQDVHIYDEIRAYLKEIDRVI